jgi:hypothetical protein
VSASAEVYISVDTSARETREPIQELIESTLKELGFDVNDEKRYTCGHYISGIIVEVKGHSVAWEVFTTAWAENLIRSIHDFDETSDVELYVYNLDREADVSVLSRDLFSENDQQVVND